MKLHKSSTNILIVENDRSHALILQNELNYWGYTPFVALDTDTGQARLKERDYTVMLINVTFDKNVGLEMIKDAKQKDSKQPIIALHNLEDSSAQINAYQNGANIFHPKPINFNILKSQIEMLINEYDKKDVIKFKKGEINFSKHSFVFQNKHIDLTKSELKLVKLLAKKQGIAFSRKEIIENLHMGNFCATPAAVDTLVSRIRKKIGKINGDEVLETVHGFGYRLVI